ncbi:MAG: phage tail assembly protein [Rhodobiaceae bacterium]|nr:phage tail assembly protein [Rhodobiaceae bacterium]MCC0054351.1 phage tail assembly protein [Rhodobiaceae bacterium]
MAATAYTLKHPTRDLAALNLHPPKVRDLEAVEIAAARSGATRIGIVKTMIACLADVDPALIDDLHHEDFEEVGAIAGGFFPAPKSLPAATGSQTLEDGPASGFAQPAPSQPRST